MLCVSAQRSVLEMSIFCFASIFGHSKGRHALNVAHNQFIAISGLALNISFCFVDKDMFVEFIVGIFGAPKWTIFGSQVAERLCLNESAFHRKAKMVSIVCEAGQLKEKDRLASRPKATERSKDKISSKVSASGLCNAVVRYGECEKQVDKRIIANGLQFGLRAASDFLVSRALCADELRKHRGRYFLIFRWFEIVWWIFYGTRPSWHD